MNVNYECSYSNILNFVALMFQVKARQKIQDRAKAILSKMRQDQGSSQLATNRAKTDERHQLAAIRSLTLPVLGISNVA